MEKHLREALSAQLLAMGDDEYLLGHRNSEWCGHAPILEEDIAFANLALDEIGHAAQWYTLLADLLGEDPERYPDRLVFLRDPSAFRCVQMVELPNGDWAHSMLRQYLFDETEAVRLAALVSSRYPPLAEAAAKIRKEELYHRRHTSAWIRRLGLGTDESHARLQAALDTLWPYTPQLFAPLAQEPALVAAGFVADSQELRRSWEAAVLPLLRECELAVPSGPGLAIERSQHTAHLPVLVADMQSVARLEPESRW